MQDVIIKMNTVCVNATWASKKSEADFMAWVEKTFANKEVYAKRTKDKRAEWAKALYKQVLEATGKPAKLETKKEGA